jgi:hypothetical protein
VRTWLDAQTSGLDELPDDMRANSSSALAVDGAHLWWIGAGSPYERDAQVAALRRWMHRTAGPQRLAEDAVRQAAVERLAGPAQAAVVYRPATWRALDLVDGSTISQRWFVPFVDTLVAAFDADRAIAVASTSLEPDRLGLLRPGPDPAPALQRLPEPAAWAVLGVADPVSLLETLPDVDPVERFHRKARTRGFELAAYREVLRDGYLGCAAYRLADEEARYRWVFFAHLRDAFATRQAIDRLVAHYGDRARRIDVQPGSELWVKGSDDRLTGALGRRDDVIWVGDAVDQILAAVRGTATPWAPALPIDALGAVELLPTANAPGFVVRIDRDGPFLVASLERYRSQTTGSLLVDVLARLLDFGN